MNKEDSEGLLRVFFNRMSYQINTKCSNICGISRYEEFMCKIAQIEELEGLDYKSSLDCYDKCLSKLFSSSMLGVGKLHDKFE